MEGRTCSTALSLCQPKISHISVGCQTDIGLQLNTTSHQKGTVIYTGQQMVLRFPGKDIQMLKFFNAWLSSL